LVGELERTPTVAITVRHHDQPDTQPNCPGAQKSWTTEIGPRRPMPR
jgi:hypothetical protein